MAEQDSAVKPQGASPFPGSQASAFQGSDLQSSSYQGSDDSKTRLSSAYEAYTNPADHIRSRDTGLFVHGLTIDRSSKKITRIIQYVALASLFGLAGSIVATIDLLFDLFDWPFLDRLLRREAFCLPQAGCLEFGLPPLLLASWAISGTAYLLALAGLLRLRRVKLRETRTEIGHLIRTASEIERERFVFLGSGQLTISLGETGLKLKVDDRESLFPWSNFDASLFNNAMNGTIWKNPDPSVLDGASLAQLFSKTALPPGLVSLKADAEDWAEAHGEHIDLPLRVSRARPEPALDPRTGRLIEQPLYGVGAMAEIVNWNEILRIVSRSFKGGHANGLLWPDFVAACTLCIMRDDKRGNLNG